MLAATATQLEPTEKEFHWLVSLTPISAKQQRRKFVIAMHRKYFNVLRNAMETLRVQIGKQATTISKAKAG
ncbi:MAG: hypothetical protein J7502_12815 [Flavisolibacter sp.]|nr:hypothetical protein [Flavisolibacter sp.]